MALEMAHKVTVLQKKMMSRSFLNSGTLIVIFASQMMCCQLEWSDIRLFLILKTGTMLPIRYFLGVQLKKIGKFFTVKKSQVP